LRLSITKARAVSLVFITSLGAAACGTSSGTSTTGLAPDAQQIFRFPLNNDIGSLDPSAVDAAVDQAFIQNVFDNVLKFDDKVNIVPDIATEVPTASNGGISSDGLTYTFKLRKDAAFSNGDKVTAADFIYSWSRAAYLQGTYGSNFAQIVGYDAVSKQQSKVLSGMTAPDPYTLIVKLSKPAGYFLAEAAAFSTGYVVDKKVVDADYDGKTWWTVPETLVGTGPFKMTARTPKQSLDFEPVANWWGSPKPTLKKIHVDVIADLGTAITKYEQGGYDDVGYGDMNGNLPQEDILRIKADSTKSAELTFVPKTRTTWVGMNWVKGPFLGDAGKPLRKAFSLAIDRGKMAQAVCSKGLTCTPATGGLISKGLKGYLGDNTDPSAKFDATTAKSLLQQADPTGSKTAHLTYTFNTGAFNQAVAENLQSQWKDNLGIQVDIKAGDRKAFFDSRTKLNEIIFRHSWQADYDHPQDWFDNLFVTGAGNGGTGYSNKKLDDLVAKADITQNVDDAIALYKQANQILVDDVIGAPLVYTQGVFLTKKYVKGAGASSFYDYYWNEIQIQQH
jgi:oligopeptide transport system substrate-binding protein